MNNGYSNMMGFNNGMGANTPYFGQSMNHPGGHPNQTMYNTVNSGSSNQLPTKGPANSKLASYPSFKVACQAARSEYKSLKNQSKYNGNTITKNTREGNTKTLSKQISACGIQNHPALGPGNGEIGKSEKELLDLLKSSKYGKFFEELERYDPKSKRGMWVVGSKPSKKLIKCLKDEPVCIRSIIFGSLLGCGQYGSMVLNSVIKNQCESIAVSLICLFKYVVGKTPNESYINLFGAQISSHIAAMGSRAWIMDTILEGSHKNYEDMSDTTNKRIVKELFKFITFKEEKSLVSLFLDQCQHNISSIAISYYLTFGMTVYDHAELSGIDAIIVLYLKQLCSCLLSMNNYLIFLLKTLLETPECACFLIYLITMLIETERGAVFKLFESHFNTSFTTCLSKQINKKSALKYITTLIAVSMAKT